MADHEISRPWSPQITADEMTRNANAQHKIAVIGSGPAGLTAALRLAQLGYGVTVFERQPVPGGMMSLAIPEYRLPRELLFSEIENIRRAGVEIRCNTALGRDVNVDDLISKQGYCAVVLAIGAWRSRRLGIPGEQLQGVINGLDFLRDVAAQASMKMCGLTPDVSLPDVREKRVAVIGGGDVAIDAARTAIRLGAREVHVIYRRAGEDMPANHLPEEIEGALNEGVRLHILTAPVEVIGNGHVTAVKLQRQRLGDFDNSARRKPLPMPGDFYSLNVDLVIPAISQSPDLSALLGLNIEKTAADTLTVDDALGTNMPEVFAAGDLVLGPSTIVQAVAQGNMVASAVDHWLHTGQREPARFITLHHAIAPTFDQADFVAARRPTSQRLPLPERENNFREVELGLDEPTARAEACRCLRCDLEWLKLKGLLPVEISATHDHAHAQEVAS